MLYREGISMNRVFTTGLVVALLVSGCASNPDYVRSQFISPAQYASYSCAGIEEDLRTISREVHTLTGDQRRRANEDLWSAGVGLVVFWPALFFLMRGNNVDDLARMRGEYEALVAASRRKDCAGLQIALANPVT